MPELIWGRVAAYLLDVTILFAILAPVCFIAQQLLGVQPVTGPEVWPRWCGTFLSRHGCTSRLRTPGRGGNCRQGVVRDTSEVCGRGKCAPELGTAANRRETVAVGVNARVGIRLGARLERLLPRTVGPGSGGKQPCMVGYFAVTIASGGRRSVHDFIARTVVQRKPNQVLTTGT